MFTVMGYTTQDSIQKRMKASDYLERKNTLEKLKLYALENGQSLCICYLVKEEKPAKTVL